jgi:hypothetical protein
VDLARERLVRAVCMAVGVVCLVAALLVSGPSWLSYPGDVRWLAGWLLICVGALFVLRGRGRLRRGGPWDGT